MKTPVWFIETQGAVYIRTDKKSGKIKRLKYNPRGYIVPCDFRGYAKGNWIGGVLRHADKAETELADRLIDQRYRIQARIVKLLYRIKKIRHVIICFHPDKYNIEL